MCEDLRADSGLCLTGPAAQPGSPTTLQGAEASAPPTALPRGSRGGWGQGTPTPWERALALRLLSQVAASPGALAFSPMISDRRPHLKNYSSKGKESP